MKKKKGLDKRVFRSLALISQFGINMLVPIGMMLWLGIWLDRKFETSWIVILCFFVGAVAGFRNIYRMAKPVMKPSGREAEEKPEQTAGKIYVQSGADDMPRDSEGKEKECR